LPRGVIISGERDEDDEREKQFVVETIHQSVSQCLTNHHPILINTFKNVMVDLLNIPVPHIGPAYYNVNPLPARTSKQQTGTPQALSAQKDSYSAAVASIAFAG
jgi:hypothetical protein